MPNKPPDAFILYPDAGAVLPPNEMVLLSGAATDREDGPLASAALSWRSDRDGDLGAGEEVLIPTLRPGWHQITVTARDSDGQSASDTIQVYIGRRVYLPVVLRR